MIFPPSQGLWRLAELPDHGWSVLAAQRLPAGTPVCRFEGPVVPWSMVPESEVQHAILLQGEDWMIPGPPARFINHACEPNCHVREDLWVETLREIAEGGQITISYNRVTASDFLKNPRHFFWDPRWSFDCRCGATECVGRVDHYRIQAYDPPACVRPATKLRIAILPGFGRSVVATECIEAGELIESAPVLVSSGKEWTDLEKTALFHYVFSWGEDSQDSAIALGYASLYNHSYQPNAAYHRRTADLLLDVVALRKIQPGEQITINYNQDPSCLDPVWFEVL